MCLGVPQAESTGAQGLALLSGLAWLQTGRQSVHLMG